MIKSNLSLLMGAKRVRVIDVARAVGVNRSPIDLLYNDEAVRVDIQLLDKLCDYFECTPNDILEYTPNTKKD